MNADTIKAAYAAVNTLWTLARTEAHNARHQHRAGRITDLQLDAAMVVSALAAEACDAIDNIARVHGIDLQSEGDKP